MAATPMTGRARALRASQTRAEGLLWEALRGRRLGGWKWRRQAPVGPYVVDFLCLEARLVVEVDGWTHGTASELAHDERRTAYLEGLGLRVHRVTNGGCYQDISGICDGILAVCEGTQPLT